MESTAKRAKFDESEGKSSEKISYLSELPHVVLDRIIEHMTIKTLKRFRRTSREFEEYVRLNRHRFNFVTKYTANELRINEKLELDFGRGSTGNWKQRFELNGLQHIEGLKLNGVSASDLKAHVIPYFRWLGLTCTEWKLEGMHKDALLSVCRSFSMESCTIYGYRLQDTHAADFVKAMQESPDYAVGYLHLRWNDGDLSLATVANSVLNDVEHIKIWDPPMHYDSAFKNIYSPVLEGNLGLYMIKRNSSMPGYEKKGCYGLLGICPDGVWLEDSDMQLKSDLLDKLRKIFHLTAADDIDENLIPW